MLKSKRRTLETDQEWAAPVSELDLSDYVFKRVSAKAVRFFKVNFKYCVFDDCYFNGCVFDSCDFTGCRIVGTSFHGSKFEGCRFDYASFEKTIIDDHILDNCCPSYDNLKRQFARTLRMNYQSLGDSEAVNKAILVELDATGAHLFKTWHSNDFYYRAKYPGIRRAWSFLAWAKFRLLDFVWGNGENAVKLTRTTALLLVLLAIVDTVAFRNPMLVGDYWKALLDSPQVFLGTTHSSFPGLAIAGITLVRLTILGLFMSILIRRFARR
jgi:uncharacterized protein YjbI with pentapeptide repeats